MNGSKLLMTLALTVIPVEAFASEWWVISQGDNEERVTLADAESVIDEGETFTVWTHLFYKYPPPGRMTNAKIQYRVRCADRSVQQLRFHDYDSQGDLLDVVDQSQDPEMAILEPVAPDTVGDMMISFVCSSDRRLTDFIPVPDTIEPRDLAAFFISGRRISRQ